MRQFPVLKDAGHKSGTFLGVLVFGLSLGFVNSVLALPEVESRTGTPVVRSSNGDSSGGTSKASNSFVEDRAAHLTLSQIEALKQELSELRGLVEEQEHTIKQLKKSQQDFYVDLDKRLSQLQNGGGKTNPKTNTATKGVQIIPKGKAQTTPVMIEPTKPVAPTPSTLVTPKPATKPTIVEAEAQVVDEVVEELEPKPPTPSQSQSQAQPQKPSQVSQVQPEPQAHTVNINISSNSGIERGIFDSAYNQVKSKQYQEATLGFQNYLTQYPQGEQAANAHYWLGEIYMMQWQSDKANTDLMDKAKHAFSSITTQFPTSPKVTDALLKLGVIESEKGNLDSARSYLREVKDRYPGSAAARIAETKLQALQ